MILCIHSFFGLIDRLHVGIIVYMGHLKVTISSLIRIINEGAWLIVPRSLFHVIISCCILYFRVNVLSFFESNGKTKTILNRPGRARTKRKERKSMSSDDPCRILPSCHMQMLRKLLVPGHSYSSLIWTISLVASN